MKDKLDAYTRRYLDKGWLAETEVSLLLDINNRPEDVQAQLASVGMEVHTNVADYLITGVIGSKEILDAVLALDFVNSVEVSKTLFNEQEIGVT